MEELGVNAGDGQGAIERALYEVAPERFDAYERLLHAVARGRVWMLLWHGEPGGPDAQYGNIEVGGYGYAPAVTSGEQLAASGWNRAHEVIAGAEVAGALFRTRWGLWLDPHAPGGGVGIPWVDLRRVALGLDLLPAGPLRLSEPRLAAPGFYALLEQQAAQVPALRALCRAWVEPALGEPYLAIGLDLYDTSPPAVEAARALVHRAVSAAPDGVAVSTVLLFDEYDPVALWLRAGGQPFYDRQAAQPYPAYGCSPSPRAAPQPGWAQSPWPGTPLR